LSVSVLAGVISGVVPACRTSGIYVSRALKEEQSRASTGRRWRRLHGTLVIAQTAMSLVLLIGAALLVRTWIALHNLDLGLQPKNVVAVNISLLESSYPKYDGCQSFFDPLLQKVRSLPGVHAAALTPYLDFGIDVVKAPLSIPGQPPATSTGGPFAKRLDVTPDFFEALGMRVLKGRSFTEEDVRGTGQCAIIDDNLARRNFGETDPIGQTVFFDDAAYTIVGIVNTRRDCDHLDPAVGALFRPRNPYWRDMVLIARTEGPPLRWVGAIRAQVAELEKDEVITNVETLEASFSEMLSPQRFSVVLLGLFAGVALTLATVGLYGLLQYTTAQQVHDIGIRMALGAERADIGAMVLRQGLKLSGIGVAVGIVGAVALTRVLSNLLYNVTPTDPLTVALVSLTLMGIALPASYIPARRTARIDPMEALRYE